MIVRVKHPIEVEEFVWVDGALVPVRDVQHLYASSLDEWCRDAALDHDPAVTDHSRME